MQVIEATCSDGDGLEWFNWLHLQVIQTVEARVASEGFSDPMAGTIRRSIRAAVLRCS